MWDSAKKPIKIRSVLQSNGMRHFIVNEETDPFYSNILLQQHQKHNKRKSNFSKPGRTLTNITNNEVSSNMDNHQYCHQNSHSNENKEVIDDSALPNNNRQPEKLSSTKKPSPLTRSNSQALCESNGKTSPSFLDTCDDFFGVAGSRICNSKKHKGYKYFPHYIKDTSIAQLHRDSSILSKCPHLKDEMFDLIPVKSPVIKKLINGSPSHGGKIGLSQNLISSNQGSSTSTTLCSRIMTWIDLEVKRNANTVKGKSLGSLPFSSADLNIVNELNDFDPDSSSSSSSADNSGSSSPLEESGNISSSSSSSVTGNCSSSGGTTSVSLPKLVPCWKKDNSKNQMSSEGKVRKSVRISDDLPRWGKMKRRLGKHDRSVSLSELCNDDELSPSMFVTDTEANYNGRSKPNCRKQYSSNVDSLNDNGKAAAHNKFSSLTANMWSNCKQGNLLNKVEQQRDSFIVCDEALPSTGKVQVHIFLPQTENSLPCGKVVEGGTGDNESNFSGRSEDSTS